MKGIPTIDCMLGLNLGGERVLLNRWIEQGLIRDEESKTYYQPAEHFFKDSRGRIEKGGSVDEVIALMDDVGVERGLVGVSVDVFVGVFVGVFVRVFVGVFVGVTLFVGVKVLVGVLVGVGVGVSLSVGVGVGVTVSQFTLFEHKPFSVIITTPSSQDI